MSKKLGNMIREARTAKGLTQAALAEQAGITSSEVGKIHLIGIDGLFSQLLHLFHVVEFDVLPIIVRRCA